MFYQKLKFMKIFVGRNWWAYTVQIVKLPKLSTTLTEFYEVAVMHPAKEREIGLWA